jgi:hypothetical protein
MPKLGFGLRHRENTPFLLFNKIRYAAAERGGVHSSDSFDEPDGNVGQL